MTLPLRPRHGGFLRPFGCGWFIRELLSGNAPYGASPIDPRIGSPQSDIYRAYKEGLMRAAALDKAVRTEEKEAKRMKRSIDPDRIDKLAAHYLARMPYKGQGCRYHSFVVYFSMLQKLGWVEASGVEEPSSFQANYPPAPPRRFYRLTQKGFSAAETSWLDPHAALYGIHR